jgi:hypothetical protein
MLRPALVRPRWAAGQAKATGVHVSRVVHQVFTERTQPVFGLDAGLAQILIERLGRGGELDSCLASLGNSFISMSEALLGELPGELPDLDAVLLAYHSPDLYRSDVAGCYLADRLPGTPVPCSLAASGPGAVFLALRVADGMCRLGELNWAALFGYDQNAVGRETGGPSRSRPDAAVLLQLGARGEAAVTELDEAAAGGPGEPGPALALAQALDRHPGAGVIAGAGLAAVLDGFDADGRVETATMPWSTGVWDEVARRWPPRQPVLLADYEPAGGRLYTALLMPAGLAGQGDLASGRDLVSQGD